MTHKTTLKRTSPMSPKFSFYFPTCRISKFAHLKYFAIQFSCLTDPFYHDPCYLQINDRLMVFFQYTNMFRARKLKLWQIVPPTSTFWILNPFEIKLLVYKLRRCWIWIWKRVEWWKKRASICLYLCSKFIHTWTLTIEFKKSKIYILFAIFPVNL